MASKSQRVKRKKTRALDYREVAVRAKSVDEESRTVQAIIATETPVSEFDWNRMEVVPRVLLTSGAEMPSQVPLQDSHERSSVVHTLGSIRNLKRESGVGVTGTLSFSSTSTDAFTKVREGHITDVSAGFNILSETYIPAGKREKIDGQTFEGPIKVATKWRLSEGSLVPIGADEQAKLRGLDPDNLPKTKGFVMDKELRALLVERGMDPELSDDDAQKWATDNFKTAPEVRKIRQGEVIELGVGEIYSTVERTSPGVDEIVAKAVKAALAEQDETKRAFHAEVDSLFEISQLDVTTELQSRAYGLDDIAKVRDFIKEEQTKPTRSLGTGIRIVGEGRDRQLDAMQTALTTRCLTTANGSQEAIDSILPEAERSKTADDFRHASVFDLAKECVELDGYSTRGLSRDQVAMIALGFPEHAGVTRSDPSIHTTGSFTVLTADAINKSMQLGYQETNPTWKQVFSQGPSAADFKTLHRIRTGAIPNLPTWNDNMDPERASFKDAEETYSVESYIVQIDFSYKLLVNDDLSQLSKIPAQMGNAASRTVNTKAWAEITANAATEDSELLFLETAANNRFRSNLTTGSATPTVATIQTMTNKMMQMRGENTVTNGTQAESDDILALEPIFIVAPTALRTTVLQLVRSIADPAASGNSGIHNPTRNLQPVFEPLLDADSTTAWYLFAATRQIETVEVTFLQGQETPVTRSWSDPKTLSQSTAILQSFAPKALNHRGMQRHDGA